MVGVEEILVAQRHLKDVVRETALQYNAYLSQKYDAKIYLKREDQQDVRSYKIRGAYNKISSLSSEELSEGVICASAGNHAQGVAASCKRLKVNGVVFMPQTSPSQKVRQVGRIGGEYISIQLEGDTFDDAEEAAQKYAAKKGLTFIHPFDDEKVIIGQGTVAHEVLAQTEEKVDYLLVPVGGGGLISGMGTYFKSISPDTQIVAVEPDGAPSMFNSMKAGRVVSLPQISKFVDGAAVKRVGDLNFEISKSLISKNVLVPEGKVCSTIINLYNDDAIVVEPAGALAIASLDLISEDIKGKTVVCVVTGGNNDLDRMPEIKERAMIYEGLKHYFMIRFPQRAGALREFVNNALGPNDDITRFEYVKKSIKESGPAVIGVELSRPEDFGPLTKRMEELDIQYKHMNDDPVLFDFFI